MPGYFFLVVPIVVPASSQNHPSSTPRQPRRQEKTLYKSLIYKGLLGGALVYKTAALPTELRQQQENHGGYHIKG